MDSAVYRLGSDIGGTFTDFVLLDARTGKIRIEKCLTTRPNPAEGVIQGIRSFERHIGAYADRTERMFHATTLVINAIIERKGARTALITTKGFRDTLEIGLEERYDVYDMLAEYQKPLVPRDLRFEVDERVHASGRILQPLDAGNVDDVVRQVQASGAAAVAVVLLHSYANPAHERAIADAFKTLAPEMSVSLSSDVLPEIKEYERTCTTTINAYARPLASTYLSHLEQDLRQIGYTKPLLVMLSGGGIAPADTARKFPVRILESGPAAGVIASEYFGKIAGHTDLIAFDMGGTTAKGCMIKNGAAARTYEFEVARLQRFKRGSGIPIKLPVVDMIEIGAGGGSIAHVTRLGTLQVGPESASSNPGPACYDRGGTLPTVSDADLLLGYLDAEHFLGGEMPLNRGAAERAITQTVGDPLSLSAIEAAWGIHDIVNENMALASKVYMLERGENPANFTLVAFGGAGPVHAYGMAKKLKVRRIIVPPAAGVMSALGLLVAPVSFDVVNTLKVRLAAADLKQVEALCSEMSARAAEQLKSVQDGQTVDYAISLDMRYLGQGYEINVPLPAKPLNAISKEEIVQAFEESYRALYQRVYADVELEIVNLRVTASLAKQGTLLDVGAAAAGNLEQARKGQRQLYFFSGFHDADVFDRSKLGAGARIAGPAVIEERESTIVVGPDAFAEVAASGIITLTIEGDS